MFTLEAFKFLIIGALLGLTAGLSPGPLLTLVVTETLRHNKNEGIKIAVTPLITDLPIVLLSFFIFSALSQFHIVLGLISLPGGVFIAWLGYETIKTKGFNIDKSVSGTMSLKKGIVANFLSPHPYLFWVTVGAPLALKAYGINLLALIFFFVSFYIMMVGSKISVAFIVERSKAFLNNKKYVLIMRLLGIVLFFFSFYFIYDGVKYLCY